MEQLKVNLENCYGINKLEHEFDFSRGNGCVIYASNGTMKTSFAKTFLDISNGDVPSDRIYGRTSLFVVEKVSSGNLNPIDVNDIYVIESFKDNFNFEKISKLLVNKDLKNKYDKVFNDIQAAKIRLIKKMASISKLKQAEVQEKLMDDFFDFDGEFLDLLVSFEPEIDGSIELPVKDIKYKIIFDEKVLSFIQQENIFDSIEEYAKKYLELIEKSEIFEKNIFTHNHASTVGKELDKNGFFRAEHQISLKNGEIIKNKVELENLIKKQKEEILSDENLKKIFEEIDLGLDKNNDSREFKKTISNYPEIIPELRDISVFKKKIWISILNTERDNYLSLIDIYKKGKDEIKKITNEAKKEESSWKKVVDLFNQRFFVPFETKVVNQEDVILNDEVPTVEFVYDDKTEEKNMDKEELLGVLSNGEKKALYLLNVIYEIEARKIDHNPVLIIIDDIADSFDYQNKYAIVEYLNDILKEDFFKLIILTHNFDFYRTVHSRLGIPRPNCFMVQKDKNETNIIPGGYLRNIFDYWKRNVASNDRILIASIPFVRNLVEYIISNKDSNYIMLTSLLHIKDTTSLIKLSHLKMTYKKIWNINLNFDDEEQVVVDLIYKEADDIINGCETGVNLENKIVMSIAIRLLAEEYMISKISNKKEIKKISKNQTRKLYELFILENGVQDPALEYLEKVNLMTPENIHLNSFMYEPILDMDDLHLKRLYQDIKAL